MVKTLLAGIELGSRAIDNRLFQQRERMFRVDNERDKKLDVGCVDNVFTMDPSGPNGHFTGLIQIEQ